MRRDYTLSLVYDWRLLCGFRLRLTYQRLLSLRRRRERAEAAHLWREVRDGQHDGDGSDAAEDDGDHRCEEPSHQPRLEAAQLVRRADEDAVDRRNPAAHRVWCA